MRLTDRPRSRRLPSFSLIRPRLDSGCRAANTASPSVIDADIWSTPHERDTRFVRPETPIVIDDSGAADREDELGERIATIQVCEAADGIAARAVPGGGVDHPGEADTPFGLPPQAFQGLG